MYTKSLPPVTLTDQRSKTKLLSLSRSMDTSITAGPFNHPCKKSPPPRASNVNTGLEMRVFKRPRLSHNAHYDKISARAFVLLHKKTISESTQCPRNPPHQPVHPPLGFLPSPSAPTHLALFTSQDLSQSPISTPGFFFQKSAKE